MQCLVERFCRRAPTTQAASADGTAKGRPITSDKGNLEGYTRKDHRNIDGTFWHISSAASAFAKPLPGRDAFIRPRFPVKLLCQRDPYSHIQMVFHRSMVAYAEPQTFPARFGA
jgi:hypothetical protein